MEKELRAYLLGLAKQYARIQGLALATVSRRLHGTDQFFRDFSHRRRTITLAKFQQIVQTIRNEWPPELPFPSPPALPTPEKRVKRRKSNRPLSHESAMQPVGEVQIREEVEHEHYP